MRIAARSALEKHIVLLRPGCISPFLARIFSLYEYINFRNFRNGCNFTNFCINSNLYIDFDSGKARCGKSFGVLIVSDIKNLCSELRKS